MEKTACTPVPSTLPANRTRPVAVSWTRRSRRTSAPRLVSAPLRNRSACASRATSRAWLAGRLPLPFTRRPILQKAVEIIQKLLNRCIATLRLLSQRHQDNVVQVRIEMPGHRAGFFGFVVANLLLDSLRRVGFGMMGPLPRQKLIKYRPQR